MKVIEQTLNEEKIQTVCGECTREKLKKEASTKKSRKIQNNSWRDMENEKQTGILKIAKTDENIYNW